MPELTDVISVKTKACNGHYVKREAEEFIAIKLRVPELYGINNKLHMHLFRLDTFQRTIMPLKRIESIDGVNLVKAQTIWKVPSSKPGKNYVVELTGKGYTCTCQGFMYRKQCRHIEEIK